MFNVTKSEMAKGVPIVFLCLLAVIAPCKALYVVNNITVPSDILTTILFDEIHNNPNLADIIVPVRSTGSYNTIKCILSLQQIVKKFPSLSVLPFIDSWGKFPSGILYGHLHDLGNFDQCVRTSVQLNTLTGTVKGQYCSATFPLIQNQMSRLPNYIGLDAHINERAWTDSIAITLGVCIPDVCDPNLVTRIFENSANTLLQGALSGIKIKNCMTNEKPPFTAINIVGIVIFSIFAALMVLSTAYDAYIEYINKPAIPLLLAFSVLTNGRKLFEINLTKSRNSIDCLTGIRVLSMAWVLLGHNYALSLMNLNINYIDLISWFHSASSMHLLSSTVSVDSFLFISGLLVAWVGMRELDKSKGKLNVPLMYFHRYIRLTPPLAAVILFYVSVNKYIGSGPYRPTSISDADTCKANWWSTLLYVQNYVNPSKLCVLQSWYLGIDTQLFFLSPLLLIPLWKWGRKFSPVLVTLSLLSIGCVIATYLKEGYNGIIIPGKNHTKLIYMPTHTRYSVWMVGLGLGYFMHRKKNATIRLSKWMQLLGWFLCFGTILAIIYGPYFTLQSDRVVTVFEASIHESFKRVAWGIALAWLVFACHFGFGGVINSFLSHPWWQPLGRLTYSMYLVHIAVQLINFGITRTDVYFSDYQEVLLFWSTFGTCIIVSIVWTLAFESPVLVIEKALLGGSKTSKPKTNEHQIESADITPIKAAEPPHESA